MIRENKYIIKAPGRSNFINVKYNVLHYTDNVASFQKHFLFLSYTIFLIVFNVACHRKEVRRPLFSELNAKETGLNFENRLTNTNNFNIYKYRNFYNGGGVAAGDVNNDGLLDVYLSANQQPNKLFLNRGNFKFEDVTAKAGVAGKGSWSTGVSMVDINADGWLDIYVCNSGPVGGDKRRNEFFINNGDGSFTDRAGEMGLADSGYSTQATFFDYDNDGDLDVYILNNSYRAIESFNQQKNERLVRNQSGGDKLFRNDGGKFVDVSVKAGIYGSEIGFGLGISVADLDRDGWMDIYVSNDFFERDYIYMNNHDGTFREELERQMPSISGASMGSDIADINEDGYPEIFTTEMLPKKEKRFKTTMTFENWDKYQFNVKNGYHHQFTRNMLQRNNGITSPKGITFSDVGRFAGVEATDWSWSVLIADLDNDSHKDLFITNGIAQDILDQDYLAYITGEEVQKMVIKKEGVDYAKLINMIPSTPIPNYAFSGNGDFNFEDVTEKWGLATPGFSNGAAYCDLDNDGDLDLIVNNVNMPLFVYRNNNQKASGHYLKVELAGSKSNKAAIGAKLIAKAGGRSFYLDQNPVRGFQSSVDNRPNFGLGKFDRVDSLIVKWPYGEETVLTKISANQTIKLKESQAAAVSKVLTDHRVQPLFSEVKMLDSAFAHKENDFVDFNKDQMIYNMYSTQGPKASVGDINGDGLQDLYLGGAKGQAGILAIQQKAGSFLKTNSTVFDNDKESEDIGSVFFDADNDGDLDLYVTSGGNETGVNSFSYVDRLYINDGKGNFTRSAQVLPTSHPESTSTVKVCDFDGDGDLDLFVGVRLRPGLIGLPQNGYLLVNNGKGVFGDKTRELAPGLINAGMISDAVWADYNGDGKKDLFVVGEWMKIRVFENEHNHFVEKTDQAGLGETSGWWNTIEAKDLDGDGDIDFVCGNHGLNSRFRASTQKPILCYINDFDQNGVAEQITCTYNGDSSYPFILRHDLVGQLPLLKKKYLKYSAYAGQTIQDIFEPGVLAKTVVNKATMLATVTLINQGNGKFEIRKLPMEAQLSPVYAICIEDFDQDGINDIVLSGNLYEVKPEVGRYDASYGALLKGTGNGNYVPLPARSTGLFIDGQTRDLKIIRVKGRPILMAMRNNAVPQCFLIDKWKK